MEVFEKVAINNKTTKEIVEQEINEAISIAVSSGDLQVQKNGRVF